MNKTSKQISRALLSINPNFSFVIEGGKIVTWYTDDPKPSEEEIVQKVAELEYQEEVNEYQRQRAREYPSYADQFDQIYHEGVDAWKASIQEVKDKYPKATMDADELQARQDRAIFDLQTERYIKATERLSQYIVLEGREEVTEEVVIGQEPVLDEEGLPTFDDEDNQIMSDVTETIITQTAIEPLEEFVEVTTTDPETLEETTESIRNSLVVKDEEERAAAQEVVDATPQAVIDAINT
jgi:hypothetical protein